MTFFGSRWDAPLLDDDTDQVPTPTGETCYGCGTPVQDGDRGLLRTYVTVTDGQPTASVRPIHTECELLSRVGHTHRVCSCHGYDSSRASALVLLARLNEQRHGIGLGDL